MSVSWSVGGMARQRDRHMASAVRDLGVMSKDFRSRFKTFRLSVTVGSVGSA